MSRGIRISEKHGVNPSLGVCYFCGKDNGDVILPGRLPNDAEAPRRAVWTKDPCRECADLMKAGVMLIEVKEPGRYDDRQNPHRTGRVWVLKDEAVRRLLQPATMADDVLRKRCAFISEKTARMLGLPDPTPKDSTP